MPAPNEMAAALMALLDDLIAKALGTQVATTDGKALTDVVYSQLHLGELVDPRDYLDPWSPIGGSSQMRADGPPPPPPLEGATPPPDTKGQQAKQAAFNTCQLVDQLLQVTSDNTYKPYPTGRHASVAYGDILAAMQPAPAPPIAADVQARIDAASKVLYETDDQGNQWPTRLYAAYQANSMAYAKAKGEYANAQAAAERDPLLGDVWPQTSAPYQMAVDQAWDQWKTQGADKIEAALSTIESVGQSMQEHAIAAARKRLEAWKVGISGVADATPYSFVLPGRWADHEADVGFTKILINSTHYESYRKSVNKSTAASMFDFSSESTSAQGGIFAGYVGADHSESDSHSESHSASGSVVRTHSAATGITISLEYGLCQIFRPWLDTELFRLKNWYLVGEDANAISDGQIDSQVLQKGPLMPMLPVRFLVVRNVKITAREWGADAERLKSVSDNAQSDAASSSTSGTAGVAFLGFGAEASHSGSSGGGASGNDHADRLAASRRATFDGSTLEITGAQIVGWISEIIPASPPVESPQHQAMKAQEAATKKAA
jgi:hypothetical protein